MDQVKQVEAQRNKLLMVKEYLRSKQLDPALPLMEQRNIRRKAKSYRLKNEELFYCHGGKERRVILSVDERKQLLKCFHASPEGGHRGAKSTYYQLKESFFWEKMLQDCIVFVSTCVCQVPKTIKTAEPELQHVKVSEPMELVGMDLIGPFTETRQGNKYILTMVDYLTKFVDAFALPSKEAEVVTKAVMTFICRWGAPKRLLSDRGKEFNNQLNDVLCQVYGIRRSMARPYHPQTNGLCERINGTLKARLLKSADNDTWDEHLEQALFSIRSQKQTSTNFTPFFLMFGREPRHFAQAPSHYELPTEQPTEDDLLELIEQASRQREAAHQKAKANQDQAHKQQSEAHSKKNSKRAKVFRFSLDQEVCFLETTGLGKRKSKQLWIGPDRIVSIHGKQIHLASGKKVREENCKPYLRSDLHEIPAPSTPAPSGPAPSPFVDHNYFAPQKMIIHGFLGIVAQKLGWEFKTRTLVLTSFLAKKLQTSSVENGWLHPMVNMASLDLVLLPVHESDHWILLVVEVQKRMVHILDSLRSHSGSLTYFNLWVNFITLRQRVKPGDLSVDGWQQSSLTSEKQTGCDDCGVFVCMNAEAMVRTCQPAQKVDATRGRHHILNMLFSHATKDISKCAMPSCTNPEKESLRCSICQAWVHPTCAGQNFFAHFECIYCSNQDSIYS